MKAIVVADQAAGTAGMKLAERPEPQAAITDAILFLDSAPFITGEILHVDGGQSAGR